MIVGVTGGRDRELTTEDIHALWNLEAECHYLIVGDCPTGVDFDVAQNVSETSLFIEEVDPALPSPRRYHERNQRIVDRADKLIAFPSPNSRGTWDTVRRARIKGIPVEVR